MMKIFNALGALAITLLLATLTIAVAVGDVTAVARDVSVPPSTNLGVALDLCRQNDYQLCLLNFGADDEACYDLGDWTAFQEDGLSSIRFFGNTNCELYLSKDCSMVPSRDGTDAVHITQANPNLGSIGWDNAAKSFRCHRDSKKRDVPARDISVRRRHQNEAVH
jgi:hypothetical protein